MHKSYGHAIRQHQWMEAPGTQVHVAATQHTPAQTQVFLFFCLGLSSCSAVVNSRHALISPHRI